MEQRIAKKLFQDIEAYADAAGLTPSQVLSRSIKASGRSWGEWTSGAASPTVRNADRIYDWMARNPAAPVAKAS